MNKINFYLESRLAAVKKRAEGNAKHNPEGAYKSALEWQVKYGRKGWRAYDSANDYDDEGNMHLYSLDGYDATPCNKIRPNYFDYTGYYADSFQHEIIEPKVVAIKAGRRGVFICPAISYSESDCAIIYLSRGQLVPADINCDEYERATMEAARLADSLADSAARDSRESDAQFQAEQQKEYLKEANCEARKEARVLIQSIRDQRAYSQIVAPICELLTDKLRELRREIRRNNQRISALSDNYWLAVE